MGTAIQSPKRGYPSVAVAIMSIAWNLPALAFEFEVGKEKNSEFLFADSPTELRRSLDAGNRISEQWGLSTHYWSQSLKTRFGLHWMRFRDSELVLAPGGDSHAQLSTDPMQFVGASFLTPLKKGSLGGEMYVRHNLPLAGNPQTELPEATNKRNALLYTLGNTVHARLSAVYTLQPTALWDNATLSMEIGRQRRTGANPAAESPDPGRSRQTRAVQVAFTPAWSDALPNLDLSLPISLSYSPKNQAPLPGLNESYKGGKFSIAAVAVYQGVWKTDLRYTHFFHEPTSSLPHKDRDFVSFVLQRTF